MAATQANLIQTEFDKCLLITATSLFTMLVVRLFMNKIELSSLAVNYVPESFFQV